MFDSHLTFIPKQPFWFAASGSYFPFALTVQLVSQRNSYHNQKSRYRKVSALFYLRETLHKARLTALHAICLQIFRHIA
jgi:hypothetical protein